MARKKGNQIVDELTVAYWMEIETVMNYIANSTNLDGLRAQEIRESLAEDIQEELGHAQRLGARIRELGGTVPGSMEFEASQKGLQPPADSTDMVAVIRGVIAAENAAITQYRKLIELCEGEDWVTQDLCIAALADEETHRRDFQGFLKEFERKK